MQLDDRLLSLLFSVNKEMPVSYKESEYLRYPLGSTDWSLIVSLPKAYLFSLSFTSINGTLLAVCIASAVSVLASVLISRQLMRKLMNMSSVIRSIEPNFKISTESFEAIDVRMPVPASGTPPDVLDELAIVFNTLLERLNHTMQNALTSSQTHEKLRYQLLRAKINPHFLYNILDSIKICNTLGRSGDANLMLSKLASFYRLILRKNDLDIITIGEELEIVDLYLNMEAISHEHTFSYAITCDTDIGLFTIPRFVLQPLVENCVTHGLPGDLKHMDINIFLHYTDDAILITIEDNGLGMSKEQMDKLMQVIRGEGIPKENGVSAAFYGLNNVCARLKPYVMHPDEPIHYESAPGKGTRVTMELKQILPDEQLPA
jgi:two-component system sensor histidine kinase YesM